MKLPTGKIIIVFFTMGTINRSFVVVIFSAEVQGINLTVNFLVQRPSSKPISYDPFAE